MSTIKKYTPSSPMWITKEGTPIPIPAMATSHLLNAIHFIERGRMQQLVSIEAQVGMTGVRLSQKELLDMLEYYTAWPEGYEDLLAEAEKRRLIKRR